MNCLRSVATLTLSICLLWALCGAAVADGVTLSAGAKTKIEAQLTRANGKRGTSACVVVDLDTGATLFSRNGDTPLSPASNMKLLTTAAALKALGGDFEFKTRLLADAPVANGALKGPLYVLGGGDPNLSGRFHDGDCIALFKLWAEKLKAAGITSIEGGVRYDSTLFGGDAYNPAWPQDDQYTKWYCAEVSALAFNDNCVGIRVLPTSPGKPAKIEVTPPTAYVNVINETRTAPGRKGAEIGIVRPRDSNTITVKGRVYEQATWGYFIDVTVHDPAKYSATVLRETLVSSGITITGDTAECFLDAEKAGTCRVLHEHKSTLLSALGPVNTNSQNLHAEMLFRMLGARYTGKGTFKTGRGATESFLREQKWWQDGLEIVDGSGLAADNRVTSSLLTRVLADMARSPHFDAYLGSLATAGESGTLEKRLKELRGTVHAKTGYIRGVRALSGYLIRGEKRVAFSILMNDCVYSKQAQDEIVEILAGELD